MLRDIDKDFMRLCGLDCTFERKRASQAMTDFSELYSRMCQRMAQRDDEMRWIARFLSIEYARCMQVHDFEKDAELLPRRRIALLAGPSGCGKTHLVKTAAWAANIPLCIIDAAPMYRDGFNGETLSHVLSRTATTSVSRDKGAALVLIENIDKVANTKNPSVSNPVWDYIDLLKGEYDRADTSQLIIMFSGVFDGIGSVTSEKNIDVYSSKSAIDASFEHQERTVDLPSELSANDLIHWGTYRDFAARLTDICYMRPLDEAAVEQIISGIDCSIEQRYANMLRPYDVEFKIDGAAARQLAEKSIGDGKGVSYAEATVQRLFDERIWPSVVRGETHCEACIYACGDDFMVDFSESPIAVNSLSLEFAKHGTRLAKYLLNRVTSDSGEQYDRALRELFARATIPLDCQVCDESGRNIPIERIVIPVDEHFTSSDIKVARLAIRAAYRACCHNVQSDQFQSLETLWGFVSALQSGTCCRQSLNEVRSFVGKRKKFSFDNEEKWDESLRALDEINGRYSEEEALRGIHCAMQILILALMDKEVRERFEYPRRFAERA